MDITLDSYITNPLGKSNSVFNAVGREAMKNDYVKRFNALMVREHGNIRYYLYKDSKKNRYYAHIKVPSETIDRFYYDVVFEFYVDLNVEDAGRKLEKYYVNFFSNDPAFNYTYSYVFKDQDLIINDLKSKLSKKAVRMKPKEKNPGGEIGYVKAIYFAYLTILNKGLFNMTRFDAEAAPYQKGYLLSQIEDTDIKIHEREVAGEKVNRQKRREKQETRQQKESDNIKVAKASTNIRTTKKITSSIKTARTTKTTKRK